MKFYCENCGSRYESDKVSGGQKVRCKKCNATFAVVQADENDPLLGQQVGGCRLIRKLGQGGMGSVYRAYMLSLDKAVAIKILSSDLGNNEEFIQRFFREARAAAKLEHHNILQVLNVGEDKPQRLHYIIMQFVDGQALTKQIRQRGRIPQLETLDIIEQVANGLKCAHDKGFIHRDIKPDNIMITSDGVPKVADFGLAKSLEETSHLTTTGTIMGTPHYMSPEQCKGEELDPRSDLYSLGVVLYEMLSGHLPFTAPSPVSVMMKHTTEEPKPIREIAPDLHPEIEALVKSMMVKDRQKRLQN
jgi:serine/threonine-protein kinase